MESRRVHITLAVVLSFLAGNVNSLTTISLLFERSSHVTGRIADIGINFVLMPIDALFMVLIWISFVIGSYLAGILLDRVGFTLSMVFQSIYILLVAMVVGMGVSSDTPYDYGLDKAVMALLLPLSMGFQNSLTSQLLLERTTHWTGDSTDLGIALAKGSHSKAMSLCLKIFAFIIGAAIMAYLIGIRKMLPFYGLLMISVALMITTFVGHRLNRKFVSG
ncbi:MAG TPA: YoaK family protein [Atribacteraceae bacterium]|nr:YoaK family protein [Atribacteraceae bacterium]